MLYWQSTKTTATGSKAARCFYSGQLWTSEKGWVGQESSVAVTMRRDNSGGAEEPTMFNTICTYCKGANRGQWLDIASSEGSPLAA